MMVILQKKFHRLDEQFHGSHAICVAPFLVCAPWAHILSISAISSFKTQVPPFLIQPSQALQNPIFCSMMRTSFTWCPFSSAPFLNCSHKSCEFPFFLGELEIINTFFIVFLPQLPICFSPNYITKTAVHLRPLFLYSFRYFTSPSSILKFSSFPAISWLASKVMVLSVLAVTVTGKCWPFWFCR